MSRPSTRRLVVPALILLALLMFRPGRVRAAVSGSGTLTATSGPVTYTAGPFLVSNPLAQTGIATGADGPVCNDPVAPCDDFQLTVTIPAGYVTQHPNDRVTVSVNWPTAADDFDMWVLDAAGNIVDSSTSSSRPEIVVLPVIEGTTRYTVRVTPFLVTGDSYTGKASLGAPPFAPYVPATAPAPTYATFAVPNGWGTNFGETSIGYNPRTDSVLFTGRRYLNVAGKTLKIKFDEATSQPTWSDVTPVESMGTTLDPIGYTDRATGRTFVSQLHGACSLTAFSDDDGATWIPSEGCGLATAVDHQTFGGGPFAGSLAGGTPVYPNAVYYCAQADVEASCAVSVDGGLTFGAGVPVYTNQCGGLHGHIKVGPDGTAYLPNKACGPHQAVIVSSDNGTSWEIRNVGDSTPGDSDPSVAIASDGTVYFGYVNGDGHVRVAVSHDHGQSWVNDVDVGTPFGIQNGVFPAMVAGDGDRAAIAFHGTTTGGSYGGLDFQGVWFLYVATTYDGGRTWSVVRAADNPVQGPGGICTIGLSCSSKPDNRNLDDFFDATLDGKGRVLVGYSDGCTGDCGPNGTPMNFDSYGTVTRQTTGLTLFAKYDPRPATEDVTAQTKIVQGGVRTQGTSSLVKVKFKNVGTQPLAAPLHVLLATVQSASGRVSAANADNGKTGTGATWSYAALLGSDNVLSPDEMSGDRDLAFDNPGKEKFSVTFRVLRGNPSSPTVASQDGANGTEVRYLRLTVDPLLGIVTVESLIR